jgi:TonB-dependent SusC/RagA subfamily outer membrane receptor
MKKLRPQIIISLFFVLYSTCQLFGQEKIVHGSVTTFDSIPLIGASIKVKSSDELVLTDTLGMFTVSCLQKDKLKVSARGFSNQNVKIKEEIKQVSVDLKLNPGPENREMAIGYGHVKDKERLYAISSVNDDDVDFSDYTDIYDLVEGRFPGVQVHGNEIIVRTTHTTMGSNAAIMVVDGMVVDESFFSSISTSDIASVNVLKGAAASIYGVSGAFGAVIVETKGRGNQ